MTVFAKLLPIVSVLAFAVLSALPWGLPENFGYTLPALPFAIIYFWTREHPRLIPAFIVFLAGITVDVLTHGPLGYWAIVYLTGVALAWFFDAVQERFGGPRGAAAVIVILPLVAATGWLLASLYFGRPVAWQPMALAAAGLALAYPLLVLTLSPVSAWISGPSTLNLDRRG